MVHLRALSKRHKIVHFDLQRAFLHAAEKDYVVTGAPLGGDVIVGVGG